MLLAYFSNEILVKEYSVEIYEWSGSSWEPYVADDVQVQFYMMSPYVLKTLATDHKVPFKFKFLWLQMLDISQPKKMLCCPCRRACIQLHSRFLMSMAFSSLRWSTKNLDTLAYHFQNRSVMSC